MKKNRFSFIYTQHTLQLDAGFTLVELMVSLALFIIVVMALVSSLFTVNSASRSAQAMKSVMDNVNFSMEAMSRTLRTGEGIVCGGEESPISCTTAAATASHEVSTRSTLGEHRLIEYRWFKPVGSTTSEIDRRSIGLVKNPNTGIETPDYTDNRGGWLAMTAPEVDVKDLDFYVDGTGANDGAPRVVIKIEGVATVTNTTPVPFAVQTLLSQRTPE